MADEIYSQIEWRLEAAWISVLATALGAAATVRRYNDLGTERSYPCVLAHCDGSESPGEDIGTDLASIDLLIYTNCRQGGDTTGEQLHTLLGNVRDVVRAEGIEVLLTNATTGLHVYKISGLKTAIPPVDKDTGARSAIVTVSVQATCLDTLDGETPEE